MPILTEPMKKYLLNDSKKGYTVEVKSAYNRRIVEYARKGIKDLALLAEKLPEDLQAKIFNEETLRQLIGNLFRLRQQVKENYSEEELREMEERRKRIVQLCYLTIDIIGYTPNAWDLARDIMDILIKAGLKETFNTLIGLKAIYIEGFKQAS